LVLEKRVERQVETLNTLMSNAPSEARPAIDRAINILTTETATWRALLIEASPSTTTEETVVFDVPNPQEDERTLKVTPEFPNIPDVRADLQSIIEGNRITDIVSYPWETGRSLPKPPIVPTEISLPLPISTSQVISNIIATTRPASNRFPPDRDSAFPHR
jgi:hypothetical protein